jgi:Cu(I)/Ag(I) efflux system membrane protein CusA/SilA
VLERLNQVADRLPRGVTPVLGPDGTGVGHVFWYTLHAKGYDLAELRAVQDWYIRYPLQAVPGVAEVASIGGFVRQYQIDLDPVKLLAHGVPVKAVTEAVRQSNSEVGGDVIEENGMEYQVRGRGYIRSREDLENIAVGTSLSGTPIYVKSLGTVQLGGESRRGLLDENGEGEVVGGIVVMRSGENAKALIARVRQKLSELSPGLPPGVTVHVAYDRSELIDRAVDTLKKALVEQVLMVTLVHVLFLWHFRSILIVTAPLPLAILISFILMHYLGVNSNIMSLGGIAIAIGVLVDAGIVMTENVIRTAQRHGDGYEKEIVPITERAAHLVGRPIFFAMLIILLAFVPVFALTGTEGKMFRPLAFTKTFAIVGSTLIAVTLVPVLCSLLVRGKLHGEDEIWTMRYLMRAYRPVLSLALAHKRKTVAIAAALFAVALGMTARIGKEFMPPLNEGSLLFMPVTLPNVSINEAKRILTVQDRIIKSVPEVAYVLGKVGRAETSTDPAPVSMIESIILLKPESSWRKGMTQEKLVGELNAKLQIPGVANGWTMPIINRINMLSTGVRTDLGVKISGDDLDRLNRLAIQAEGILRKVPGAADVVAERTQGGNYIDVQVDREAAARYGLTVDEVNEVVETALGGKTVTWTIEGRQRFPVRVRFLKDYRQDIERIRRIPIPRAATKGATIEGALPAEPAGSPGSPAPQAVAGGSQVLLGQVAKVTVAPGPAMIYGENTFLRSVVFLNVRGRDVGRFVDEAKETLSRELKLPKGYFLSWTGQYENQIRARKTLMMIVPVVFVIVFVLLMITYHSMKEAAHVILAIPFALTGGIYLVYFLGYNFSVAVWVGFIALFGTAIETGVVMVIFLEEAVSKVVRRDGTLNPENLREGVMEGAVLRLRPKLMTVVTDLFALAPIFWSTETGAEVMKPLAAPVVGGMVSSLLHVLVVTPVLFTLIRERQLRKGTWKPGIGGA